MKRTVTTLILMSILQACSSESSPEKVDPDPNAAIDLSRGGYQCFTMTTSFGDIELALDKQRAPITTDNFATYAKNGFYDGTLFHRVIDDFVVQGGGYGAITEETTLDDRKATRDPIPLESDNGLKNYRGRIAMARGTNPNSATSQFFINLADNHDPLDYIPESNRFGYAVFGGVISGMDVVEQISNVEVGKVNTYFNVPTQDIFINSVTETNCPAS